MQSFRKKINTLIKTGISPLKYGIHNFNNPTKPVERLAVNRLSTCIKCEHFVDEPIDFLKVEDNFIPALSNKMCGECGCTLSYKTRQSILKCERWQE